MKGIILAGGNSNKMRELTHNYFSRRIRNTFIPIDKSNFKADHACL